MAEEKPIGKVIHYYDNISVAIVKLEKKLSVGKTVKFVKGDNVFEQTVESMEIKHGKLTEAKPGDENLGSTVFWCGNTRKSTSPAVKFGIHALI
ncbi:MAG: hypothetical protein UW37_C0014G0030 [Candidatus Gottesmanbacteria bacterium GW2011_GWA2_44_17]|uniref:Uncharacterized protein n=1 Tax=Candidatus Gottesmanbacteria bacterium GW2011_GWA2_44_17 TaxID=1618444 RepID=A0A0G1HKD0_9BACT|nr:MAG: hypothetical protein UW37_C0014G0030 [Candidatus Gottesmanbacteria bacterium GW2011_GWA2_44_17]